jgi:hypothetical protein
MVRAVVAEDCRQSDGGSVPAEDFRRSPTLPRVIHEPTARGLTRTR